MVRGGEVSPKRKFKTRVRSKGNHSDDSDEDYVVSDEGNEVSACSDEDYGYSVDGNASEASFDSFAEEEAEEEERKVRRKAKKVGKSKRRKCLGRFKGEEDDEYALEEEEEDEDEDEEWNEVKTTGRSKVQGGSTRLRRNSVIHIKNKEEEEEEFEDEDKDEQRDKVKTTSRSKVQGGFSRLRKNGVINSTKKDDDEEEKFEDEEEEFEDEDGDEEKDEVRVTCRSKVQGGSSRMRKNGVIHSKRKRRVTYKEDDENDDDDEEFTPSNGEEEEDEEDEDDDDDDDEDFTADDDDYLDEEESSVKRKKNKMKAGKRTLRKKGSVRRHNRRLKSMASKKPMRKKARKTCGFRRKVRSDDDVDFIDKGLVLKDKGEMKMGPKRRRFVVDSDSDFVPSPSNEYEYTISEEEREQVREAKEFCRMKSDLKTSLTSDKIQEVVVLQPERKPKVRKGKEKVEEEVRAEVAKKVCGICLSEEDKRRVRGRLNCCTHYFCFTCITEWAKVESRCPLCKQRFNTISKRARSKAVVDLREVTIQVPERDQVYQPTEEELRSYLYPYEDVICSECHQGGHDDLMLLCDECDSSAHTFCIGLGYEVPEGSWYCRDCKPLAPESPSSLAPTRLSDQRTANYAMTHRASTGSAGEGFDLNSVSQGLEALPSPRQYIGGFQSTLPFSGAGASTVSSRMRLQHHVQQCLSERLDRPDGTFPNSQSDQGREAIIQRASTLFLEERSRENPSPAMQVTELLPPGLSQSRRQMGQDPITVFSGIANGGALWPGLAERNSLPGYQQQLRQCNGGPNSGCDREEGDFHTAKDQLQLMVKSHLKNLSRTIEIAQRKLEEIAKGSTQTILVACELEQRSNEVAPLPVAPPPNCDHGESIPGGKVSLWRGCCSSCFDSFVGDVVKKILDAKLSEERQWLNLNLAL